MQIPVAGVDQFVRGRKERPDKIEAVQKHQTKMSKQYTLDWDILL